MGLFDWLFGDDEPQPTPAPTTQTQSTVTYPPYVESALRELLSSGQQIVSQPYVAYPYDRLAGFDPLQQEGFQLALDQIGVRPELYAGGITNIGAAGAPLDVSQVDRYLNPYLQGVGGQIERELDRRHAQNLQDIGTDAYKAGGFGGTRHAVLEAEAGRNLERNIADVYERLYSGGYDKALTAVGADREAALKSAVAQLPAIGGLSTAMGQDVASLLGIGGAYQGLSQESLNLAYQDWIQQRDYPYQQLGFYSNLIRGQPYSTSTSQTRTGTNYVTDPGVFGDIVGGVGGLLSASPDTALGRIGGGIVDWIF